MYNYSISFSVTCLLLFMIVYFRNRCDEPLPDLIWCREPFLEEMKEISDLKDI